MDWTSTLRVLTYGIIQTPEPMRYVDPTIASVIDRKGRSPDVFITAIREGLASKEDLAVLFDQDHKTDADVRTFLRAIEAKLLERLNPG